MDSVSTEIDLQENPHQNLFRNVKRGVLFLTLLLATLVLFYFIGNRQRFLDRDIKLILILTSCTSAALILFLLGALAECIYCAISLKRKTFLFWLIPFIIDLAAAVIFAIASTAILLLSSGFPPQN